MRAAPDYITLGTSHTPATGQTWEGVWGGVVHTMDRVTQGMGVGYKVGCFCIIQQIFSVFVSKG